LEDIHEWKKKVVVVVVFFFFFLEGLGNDTRGVFLFCWGLLWPAVDIACSISLSDIKFGGNAVCEMTFALCW
jgi:hypothetical protein